MQYVYQVCLCTVSLLFLCMQCCTVSSESESNSDWMAAQTSEWPIIPMPCSPGSHLIPDFLASGVQSRYSVLRLRLIHWWWSPPFEFLFDDASWGQTKSCIKSTLLSTETSPPLEEPGIRRTISSLLPLPTIPLIFYFFFIRPLPASFPLSFIDRWPTSTDGLRP